MPRVPDRPRLGLKPLSNSRDPLRAMPLSIPAIAGGAGLAGAPDASPLAWALPNNLPGLRRPPPSRGRPHLARATGSASGEHGSDNV